MEDENYSIASMPQSPTEALVWDLLDAVSFEDWNWFLELLEDDLMEEMRRDPNNEDDDKFGLGVVLHALCCGANAPLEIFKEFLCIDTTSTSSSNSFAAHLIAYVDSTTQRNSLHTAAEFLLDRPDVFQLLLETVLNDAALAGAADVLWHVDTDQLRPLDVLCKEIVLLERFVQSLWPLPQVQHLRDPWKCAHMLLCACYHFPDANSSSSCNRDGDEKTTTPPKPLLDTRNRFRNIPVLHSCFAAPTCSRPFWALALRRHGRQLLRHCDHRGNLPLHYAAENPHVDESMLRTLVNWFPTTARAKNRSGQTPFDVAKHAGRQWHTGCQTLLEAHPNNINQCGAIRMPAEEDFCWNGTDDDDYPAHTNSRSIALGNKQQQLKCPSQEVDAQVLLAALAHRQATGVVYCALREGNLLPIDLLLPSMVAAASPPKQQ